MALSIDPGRKDSSKPSLTVLTFSPYSFINVHSYPEAIIADTLRRRGHRVIQVRCKGLYADYCISMSAVGLTPRSSPSEKAAICAECNIRREAIEQQFGFETLYIDDFVSGEMLARVDRRMAEVNSENWANLEYDGIPIPRYASTEYFLNEKINATAFDPALWGGFLTHVRNAFVTAEAGQKILEYVKADRLLAYNNIYSCNHVMCCLAEKQGAAHYSLHAGPHLKHLRSQMTIFQGLRNTYLRNRSSAWKKFSGSPVTEASVRKVSEHIDELMEARSSWVYSIKSQNKSPEQLRAFFGIRPDQKVLLATMSSMDELFSLALADAKPLASKEPIFSSQIAWIQSLINWIKDRDDLFLIVRVHPREFPNKREQVLAPQASLLRKTFVDFPANAKVNWPDDALSLHDVARITDVGLNATSSAGLELLLFGIPVVLYDLETLINYPIELSLCAESVDDYFEKVDLALRTGRSSGNVISAFRWLAFQFDVAAIDISEAYSEGHSRKVESQNAPPRGLFSKIKELLKGVSKSQPLAFKDTFFNLKGLGHLRQSNWLAYAIEHRTANHMDAYCDALAATEHNSSEEEYTAIAAAAKKYLRKLDMPVDLFK